MRSQLGLDALQNWVQVDAAEADRSCRGLAARGFGNVDAHTDGEDPLAAGLGAEVPGLRLAERRLADVEQAQLGLGGVLQQVAQRLHVEREARFVREGDDDRADALLATHEPRRRQHPDRLACGEPADAELLAQLEFGGQPGAHRVAARHDGLLEVRGDLEVAGLGVVDDGLGVARCIHAVISP